MQPLKRGEFNSVYVILKRTFFNTFASQKHEPKLPIQSSLLSWGHTVLPPPRVSPVAQLKEQLISGGVDFWEGQSANQNFTIMDSSMRLPKRKSGIREELQIIALGSMLKESLN